jgi:hypothetical protein
LKICHLAALTGEPRVVGSRNYDFGKMHLIHSCKKAALLYPRDVFASDLLFNLVSHRFRFTAARFYMLQRTETVKNIPNGFKIYQTDTKYTKWPQNIPNGHKINQMAVK